MGEEVSMVSSALGGSMADHASGGPTIDDDHAYRAIDGRRIDIPPLEPLAGESREALRKAATRCGGAWRALAPQDPGHEPPRDGAARDYLLQKLAAGTVDVRHIEALDVAAATPFKFGWQDGQTRPTQRGDFLRRALLSGYGRTPLDHLPRQALWPYLAQNLQLFDEALGLSPASPPSLNKLAAIKLLRVLPATPARYSEPLMAAAAAPVPWGRDEVRALLSGAPDLAGRLIGRLSHESQSARVGAARWLAQRMDHRAAAALWGRLKVEKAQVVRATLLAALRALGEDLSPLLGPDALAAEAKKGLKSGPLDRFAWLSFSTLPAAHYRSGERVPQDVLRWWAVLACRLKQAGGDAMLAAYLDELEPSDAASVSVWALDSWIAYDTVRMDDTEAVAAAKARAAARHAMVSGHAPHPTIEEALAAEMRNLIRDYKNDGREFKGLLALALRAPPPVAAGRVRAYFKAHKRIGQSMALLDFLAGIGEPATLQTIMDAAARHKKNMVRRYAAGVLRRVAEEKEWSPDELADRSIPTAGFDEAGCVLLPCEAETKIYEARLTSGLDVEVRNPSGKVVTALPSGKDEATAAARKLLSAAKTELKQTISSQTARLYEAMCGGRVWPCEDWLRFYHRHPIMRRLSERVVWMGCGEDGAVLSAFRPTAEGDFTDCKDDPAALASFANIRLAHASLVAEDAAEAWLRHLADYEVAPLFRQFRRAAPRCAPGPSSSAAIEDRKGWAASAAALTKIAATLGYEPQPNAYRGTFSEFRKPFVSCGLIAAIEITGAPWPTGDAYAALISLRFENVDPERGPRGPMALGDTPPVLLSECWSDYHEVAANAAFDPAWESKCPR